MHLIIALMTGISSEEAWLPQPDTHTKKNQRTNTHTLTHLLPLLPVSLLSLVPAEQWRDDLSLSGMKKDKYEPKKRVEGSRKEREAGAKERQHLYFLADGGSFCLFFSNFLPCLLPHAEL